MTILYDDTGLQLSNGGSTQEVDSQTPTCYECCPPRLNTDEEVRLGLTQILHDELHWLDVPESVQFKLCIQVYKCLHGITPKYMMKLCRPVSTIEGRLSSSAARGQLDVPCTKLLTFGRRAFSYAGPSAWNMLPDNLKDSSLTLVMFKRALKTFLFSKY